MNELDWVLVVVHHRDPAAVQALLESTGSWSAHPALAVVVDNSGDFDPAPCPVPVEVVRAPWNPGYAAAANLGAAVARDRGAGRVLLCTQDAHLALEAAERLLDAMENDPRIALAGPVLMFRDEPHRVFSAGGRLSRHGEATHPGRDGPAPAAAGVVDADWLDGAINLVRLEALDAVGGWDEGYFLYVEEVDLQWRLRRAGGRVVLVQEAVGYQQPGRYPPYLRFRNSVYFTRKFAGDFRGWPWRRQLVRQVAKSTLAGRPLEPVAAVRGVLDARHGRMGCDRD